MTKNESNKMKITSESKKKNQLNLATIMGKIPIIYSFDSTSYTFKL